ncbi:MAG TPA: MotA/TolQ/ExbB proton channel family protein [Candidatus Angelobacter sp.]|nr:MotA/TolQ/ExbB proton channel family protein [Candidatus Angelobacter sp.]
MLTTSPQFLPQGRAVADSLRDGTVTDFPQVGRRSAVAAPTAPAFAEPMSVAVPDQERHGNQIAFASRCVVLQTVGAAGLLGLWYADLAGKPFEGNNAPLCWLIVAMGALGIACVFLQRWRDVQWIATHVVRIGLLGTVVGLIIAFSAARTGASAEAEQIKTMIGAVVSGMYVSLYATLLGIATNLWLKINLRLLGDIHG